MLRTNSASEQRLAEQSGPVDYTLVEYPRDSCVHELFEEWVNKTPDAVAEFFNGAQMTYRELNTNAEHLARRLRREGIGPDLLVGVCCERSLDLIVALLAVLKAGGAYLPLDSQYPAERLRFMIEDSQAAIVVGDEATLRRLPEISAKLVSVEAVRDDAGKQSELSVAERATSTNLAYVTYTSGSTGQPKGVMIEHRSVVRLVRNTNYAEFGPSERFLHLAPVSFDAATFEIWGALLNGGCVVVMPPGTPSLDSIKSTIRSYRVTTMFVTTALFNLIAEQPVTDSDSLRQIIFGGEAVSVSHCRKMAAAMPNCELIHAYGPTENTTFTTCLKITKAHLDDASIPIGYPIANSQVYVVDPEMNQVATNVVGEICIAGDGLARGYLNRPELNAERFVVPNWSGGHAPRLYRSGDLGFIRDDGALDFKGRLDSQVKISGFRVEPDEVTIRLRQHPAVRDAIVVAAGEASSDKILVAYVVPASDGDITSKGLRSFLQAKLPQFMIPARYVILEKLPLNPNGKIDRALLPVPGSASAERNQTSETNDSLEQAIAGIWQRILKLETFGVEESFFELGGDSLQLIECHAALRKQLNLDVSITDLFQYPSVGSLSRFLRGANGQGSQDRSVETRAEKQRQVLQRMRATRGA